MSAAQSNNMALAADTLDIRYDGHAVVERLALTIVRGGITALVGPNGSGKSTLLKALDRLLKPSAGAGDHRRRVGRAGALPHAGPLRMLRRQDHAAIRAALALTNTAQFAERPLDSLSGGERQRAWIALALTQATPILLLDELTTVLDIDHQLEILDLVRRLNCEQRLTMVLVLHDLNQAARYADRMVALQHGQIVADGAPAEVLTTALLATLFGVQAHIITNPQTGAPVCLPFAYIGATHAAR